jgi:hypothetical protein
VKSVSIANGPMRGVDLAVSSSPESPLCRCRSRNTAICPHKSSGIPGTSESRWTL